MSACLSFLLDCELLESNAMSSSSLIPHDTLAHNKWYINTQQSGLLTSVPWGYASEILTCIVCWSPWTTPASFTLALKAKLPLRGKRDPVAHRWGGELSWGAQLSQFFQHCPSCQYRASGRKVAEVLVTSRSCNVQAQEANERCLRWASLPRTTPGRVCWTHLCTTAFLLDQNSVWNAHVSKICFLSIRGR